MEGRSQEKQNAGRVTQGILEILQELCPHQRQKWSRHTFAEDRYVIHLHATFMCDQFQIMIVIILQVNSKHTSFEK